MYGNKGISFTLEAIIAGFIIMTALLFLFRPANVEEIYDIGVSERGYNCLKYLDDKGFLREDAMNDENESIGNRLQDCLSGMNYTVQICRVGCNPVSIPENQTIIVSSYYIAGDVDSDPLKVKLSMWL